MFQKINLNHSLISERYFFPHYEPFENAHYFECNGNKLACYYSNKFTASKTVIYFHGNGEVVADYIEFFPQIFEQAGYNLLLFEFRGYGMSSGKPALVSILDDVECLIKQLDAEEKDLIFYGRSVGSIYAVHAASKFPDAYALILESGIVDVEERIMMRINDPSDIACSYNDLKEEFEQFFNTKNKLASFKGKSLIMHTVNDQLVSVAHGKQLYDYCNEPKKIHLFEYGDHNTIFAVNGETYFKLLFEFLNSDDNS